LLVVMRDTTFIYYSKGSQVQLVRPYCKDRLPSIWRGNGYLGWILRFRRQH